MTTGLAKGGSAAVTWTAWIILACAALLSLLTIRSASNESDAVSIERQVRSAQHAIDTSIDELALQQEGVAIWDDAAAQVVSERRDRTWIHDNIGSWLHRLYKQNEIVILDGADQPIYAAVQGEETSAQRYRALEPELSFLVTGVRGRITGPNGKHDRNAGVPLSPNSTVRTTARTTHDSHLMLVDGRPAVASAMLMQPSTPNYVKPVGQWPILISVRYLDESFLAELGSRQLLAGARISQSPEIAAGEHAVPLETEWGEQIAYFIWKPDLPGSRILSKIAPVTLTVLTIITILVGLLSRRLRRAIRKASSAALEAHHLARHDPLTGLPNRAVVQERLEQLISPTSSNPFTLVIIDVDEFKIVNDTLGHDAGDALLQSLGQRLIAYAGNADVVARLGGDEFAVLLIDDDEPATAKARATALFGTLGQPVEHNGKLIECRISAGATIYQGAGTPSSLLKEADLALYASKAAGRCTFRYYDPSMSSRMHVRQTMIRNAKEAVAGDFVSAFYQPKVCLKHGTIVGFEALLRCRPPGRPVFGPHRISAAFEDRVLATELSKKIRSQVAADMARWRAAGLDFGHVAINAAAAELTGDGFAQEILAELGAAGLKSSDLQLEITESVLLGRQAPQVQRTLEELSASGVKIALDDFGTGFASLSHLKQFPVNVLKIDRAFIRQLQVDELDGAIVHALIELSHALDLEIVAEGIETTAQRDFLAALGCTTGQGYLFGRPGPASSVPIILGQTVSRAAVA